VFCYVLKCYGDFRDILERLEFRNLLLCQMMQLLMWARSNLSRFRNYFHAVIDLLLMTFARASNSCYMPLGAFHKRFDADDSPYAEKQARRERDYRAAYLKWVAKVPEKQRKEMERQGLDKVLKDTPQAALHDVSKMPVRDEMAEVPGESLIELALEEGQHVKTPAGHRKISAVIREEVKDQLRLVMAEIVASDNIALSAECFALLTGLAYYGASEASLALKYGCTRAAVSKRVTSLGFQLGLSPSRAMRSERARAIYSDTQMAIHSADDDWEIDNQREVCPKPPNQHP
jgi:hypothetical protein